MLPLGHPLNRLRRDEIDNEPQRRMGDRRNAPDAQPANLDLTRDRRGCAHRNLCSVEVKLRLVIGHEIGTLIDQS
jgi:hypothetical protein